MKTKPLIAGALLIIVIAAVAFGLWRWNHKKSSGPQGMMEVPPDTVEVADAKAETWQPSARLVGTVVGKRAVNLAGEVAGVISRVGFDSGVTVEPGQVLVQLNSETEMADLAAARAAFQTAKASEAVTQEDVRVAQTDLAWAESNLKRYQGAGRSVSEADADKAKLDLDRARATLARQQASLEKTHAETEQAAARVKQIETLIDKHTLKAPFRARVGMRTVHEGQYLAEGTSIVMLTELTDDIYLDFAIPQEYTPLVVPGSEVIAKSTVLGSDAARIKVLSMDATVNPTTRNVRVRTSIPNPGFALKPGMSIDVEVPVGPPQQVVTIPTTSVRRAAFGDHVYVLGPGEKGQFGEKFPVKQQMVTLGATIGDRVIVSKGVSAGDRLAAGGSFKLHEGSKVVPAVAGSPKPESGESAGEGKNGSTEAPSKSAQR